MHIGQKDGASTYERIIVYSEPKSGKTRFVTSLPERFGKIAYVAADPGSESLSPVVERHRERVAPIIQILPEPGKIFRPRADAATIAMTNWGEKFPGVKTLVWDTLTYTAQQFLADIADSGEFSESKHIRVGEPGKAGSFSIPMEGDYGAAQGCIDRLVDFLFRLPLHLIVVCHATYDEPKGGGTIEGGPATVGKATVRKFPGRFDTCIHLVRKDVPGQQGAPSKTEITAFTERHGIWQGGIRSSHLVNPLPKEVLEPDPVSWWEKRDKVFGLS